MNTSRLLHQEIDHTPEPILREVYHYLLYLRSKGTVGDGSDAVDLQAGVPGGEEPKMLPGGREEDRDWRDPYELGKDLFGHFASSEPPTDPLKRQIWEHLHERHSAR